MWAPGADYTGRAGISNAWNLCIKAFVCRVLKAVFPAVWRMLWFPGAGAFLSGAAHQRGRGLSPRGLWNWPIGARRALDQTRTDTAGNCLPPPHTPFSSLKPAPPPPPHFVPQIWQKYRPPDHNPPSTSSLSCPTTKRKWKKLKITINVIFIRGGGGGWLALHHTIWAERTLKTRQDVFRFNHRCTTYTINGVIHVTGGAGVGGGGGMTRGLCPSSTLLLTPFKHTGRLSPFSSPAIFSLSLSVSIPLPLL